MASRVTIQDIADALGLSRNTVSKAINNTGVLADATREKILKKAMELGYKQFSYMEAASLDSPAFSFSAPEEAREISLFTTSFLGNSHFASAMLDKFQQELSLLGYSLTIHRILGDDVKALRLPGSFVQKRTAGIACIEMFDPGYSSMLCRLGLPALFIDSPAVCLDGLPQADRLYMDNQSNIFLFVQEMARRGKKKIGFIGEYLHCQSFFERFMAYRDAMHMSRLPCEEKYCILKNKDGVANPSPSEYREYLTACFQAMDGLPEVFLCANDFVAIDAMQSLKQLGYLIPQDVYLCGFDDSPDARVVTPSLTSIHIHSQVMGVSAARLLSSRIQEPSLNYRTVHTETNLVYRESTGDGW